MSFRLRRREIATRPSSRRSLRKQHLEEIYSVEVSPALISSVTDAVQEEVTLWQSRPLDALYPVIYLNALQVKIRDGAHVRNKAIYLLIGVNLQGLKEVLGLWIEQMEGREILVTDFDRLA